MSAPLALIHAWARSPVAPVGGALAHLRAHELATPVLHAVLQQAGLEPSAVDAVVVGNALGAGGNPARMVSLAAGLPTHCASYSVDTQCCAGLDAITLGLGLIASGQAQCVLAGGVEAWSRAPLRLHRPLHAAQAPVPYDRPAFAPDPTQDPDLLQAATDYAQTHGYSRAELLDYAMQSHQRAVQHQAELATEIVPVAGCAHDSYPRLLDARKAQRMSALTTAPKADGAAFVLLLRADATPGAHALFTVCSTASVGGDSRMPLRMAAIAAEQALQRVSTATGALAAHSVQRLELHDAFAVQGLDFCQTLGITPERINPRGGGVARGHPIGASGTIALVRVLTDLHAHGQTGDYGLAAIAGAGGLGAAIVVQRTEASY
ncbi:thiolase family protein [Curvibacter sp. CHRR-16]|uniref:thiolase family protein n=1 Tax=Curvibacter sp. CHRR-16 TaxID=2835872 RepID=UPI001BDAFCA7|nr:thiolase family protein [Curvibacter sp. CHRR-16]MBT0569611.1 thiolase family protein [Curvibacter sp. CHRR-16]